MWGGRGCEVGMKDVGVGRGCEVDVNVQEHTRKSSLYTPQNRSLPDSSDT